MPRTPKFNINDLVGGDAGAVPAGPVGPPMGNINAPPPPGGLPPLPPAKPKPAKKPKKGGKKGGGY